MLQYILVASAYRLACGQGLHVQPAPSWNLTREEKSLRQCIFWAIYCLDKEIACRSGRPSVCGYSIAFQMQHEKLTLTDH